jgi:hypothetical protein
MDVCACVRVKDVHVERFFFTMIFLRCDVLLTELNAASTDQVVGKNCIKGLRAGMARIKVLSLWI